MYALARLVRDVGACLFPPPLRGRVREGGKPRTPPPETPTPDPSPQGGGERENPVTRGGHQPLPSNCRRCSRSYNTSGPTSSTSNTTATADATGQSLLVKNSSHRLWPIISALEPASRSGITNSPMIGMKHSNAPAATPGNDRGNVTSQNACRGEAPRSLAASSSAGSILASVA